MEEIENADNILIFNYQKLLKEVEKNPNDLIKKTKLKVIMDQLYNKYQRLIGYYLRKYSKYPNSEDRYQDCVLAFVGAVKKFDITKNVKFSTFLAYVIMSDVFKKEVGDDKITSFKFERNKAIRNLAFYQNISNPTDEEIAKEMNIDIITYSRLIKNVTPMSLDAVNEFGQSLTDSIIIDDSIDVVQGAIDNDMLDIVKNAIEICLKRKQKDYLYLYLIKGYTQGQIEEMKNVSHQNVSNIIQKGLKRLRLYLINNKLSDYFDDGVKF